MSTSDNIAIASLCVAAATMCVTIVGLVLIWFQLRQATSSSKGSLLLSINRDLNQYIEVAVQIEEGIDEEWVSNLSTKDRERLLDYISYFEGIYLAHARGLFDLKEINDYFAGRFFRLTNNTGVQRYVFLNEEKYGDIFRPIFLLHQALTNYRKDQGLPTLVHVSSYEKFGSELPQRKINNRDSNSTSVPPCPY